MAKIYVLTVGEHSEYRILGAFSEDQKGEADRNAGLIGGDVEEFELNAVSLEDPGMDYFCLVMFRDGTVSERAVYPRLDRWSEGGEKHESEFEFRTSKDKGMQYEGKNCWRIYWAGYAKSKEHVVKIMADTRRQILAGQRPKGVDMGEN